VDKKTLILLIVIAALTGFSHFAFHNIEDRRLIHLNLKSEIQESKNDSLRTVVDSLRTIISVLKEE
jgi:hypothetical protein